MDSRDRSKWYSRKSRVENLSLALLGLGGASLLWFGSSISSAKQVVLWSLLLLALAFVLRRGWLKLFGPVLLYELVRTARRGRYYLIRLAYVCLLSFLLFWIYGIWFWFDHHRSSSKDIELLSRFSESFFDTYMVVQFLAVILLTPAYTAGSIAEEKERKTLEFLLATDLENREIVFGKLLARLANLSFILLAGLPILSFLQFLGGVDPDMVWAGFVATGITMLSIASTGILNSVIAKRARDAMMFTYMGWIAYLCVAGTSFMLLIPEGWASYPSTDTWISPITVNDLVQGINAGNILHALAQLFGGGMRGSKPADLLPGILRDFVVFHGLVALVCTGWAVFRLRVLALKQAEGAPPKPGRKPRKRWRTEIGDQPIFWREVFVEGGQRSGWLQRVVVLILVIASLWPAGLMIGLFLDGSAYNTTWNHFDREMNVWVRIAGTSVACLLLLGVAVRASGSISSERDRQTFETLLTSPLSSDEILHGKWFGSVLSVRWGWLWMGVIAGLGLFTGGVHPLALPLLLVAWFVYAGFLSSLGLWFSTVSRTTLRANVYTLLSTCGIFFGHWIIWMCCIPLAYMSQGFKGSGREMEWIVMFQAFALTPPATLAFLAFQGRDFDRSDYGNDPGPVSMLIFSVIGLGLYALGAVFVQSALSDRFRALTGRNPYRKRSAPAQVVAESSLPVALPVEPLDEE